MVELIERLSDGNQMSCYDRRFQFCCCILDLIGECFQQFADIQRCFIRQCGIIDPIKVQFACSAQDGACTGMCILYIRACFTVKVQHSFPAENNVFDSGVIQIIKDHSTDTNLFCDFFFIFQIGVLFFDDSLCFCASLIQQVFHQNNVAASCGKLAAVQRNQTEGNVDQIFIPVVAHFVDDFEPLCKVQVLIQRSQVYAFIKVICFLAVQCCSDISCCIQCAAVFTDDQAGRHIFVFQIYDHCAFGFFQQFFRFQFFHNGIHFVVIEGFASVRVEGYTQHFIYAFKFFDGNIIEPFPQSQCFFFAVLHFYEPQAGFIIHIQFGMGFCFIVELNINTHQFLNTVFFYGFLAAPVFVSYDQLTKLCAPVAQMVDAFYIVAQFFVDFVQGVTNYCGTQVTNVERFCDIRGGIVDDNGFACAHVAFTVVFFLFQHCGQNLFRINAFIQEEVDISANHFHFCDEIGFFDFFDQFRSDHRGSLAEYFCQTETGVSKVTHFLFRGNFHCCRRIFYRDFCCCRQQFCDFYFKIHIFTSKKYQLKIGHTLFILAQERGKNKKIQVFGSKLKFSKIHVFQISPSWAKMAVGKTDYSILTLDSRKSMCFKLRPVGQK